MQGSSRESVRGALALGLACIACGLILNPWTIAHTLSPDGVLDRRTTMAVLVFDGLWVAAGGMLLALRHHVDPVLHIRNFAKRQPNLAASIFGLALCLLFAASVEYGYYYANARTESPEVYHYSNGDLHGFDPY